jgi:hypothetical protein
MRCCWGPAVLQNVQAGCYTDSTSWAAATVKHIREELKGLVSMQLPFASPPFANGDGGILHSRMTARPTSRGCLQAATRRHARYETFQAAPPP